MPNRLAASTSARPLALKRRLYSTICGIGTLLTMLYVISIAGEGNPAALILAAVFLAEIAAFFLLFLAAPRQIETIEVAFYAVIEVSLVLVIGGQIFVQHGRGTLIPDKLGFFVSSLVLWLSICQLGAFLALPTRQVHRLLALGWASVALLLLVVGLLVQPPEEWRYSYVVSWAAGLAALCMQTILLTWLGRRQHQHATTDALTGTANRHLLADQLRYLSERAQTQQRSLAILLIDIDHFKVINDTFGHAVGDQVLSGVAAAIQRQVRASDQVGRWGGDEFLVLLVDTELPCAQQVAERVRSGVALHGPYGAVRPTLSIGIHALQAGQSIEDALACADRALYRAKQAGRDRACVWRPGEHL